MSYDLSGETASSGKPKGKFTLRCLSAKIKQSKKGEDMFAVEFMIAGKEFNKFKIYDMFMLQGAGAVYAKPKLAYLMDRMGVERNLDNLTPWLSKTVDAELGQDKDGFTKVREYFDPTAVEENAGENF